VRDVLADHRGPSLPTADSVLILGGPGTEVNGRTSNALRAGIRRSRVWMTARNRSLLADHLRSASLVHDASGRGATETRALANLLQIQLLFCLPGSGC
jgi:hypothetical protein